MLHLYNNVRFVHLLIWHTFPWFVGNEDAGYTLIQRKQKGQEKEKKEEKKEEQPQQQVAKVDKPFFKSEVPQTVAGEQKPKKNRGPRQPRKPEDGAQATNADTQPEGEQPERKRGPKKENNNGEQREPREPREPRPPREPKEPRVFVPVVPPTGAFDPASVDELIDSITNYYSKQDKQKPAEKKQQQPRRPQKELVGEAPAAAVAVEASAQ